MAIAYESELSERIDRTRKFIDNEDRAKSSIDPGAHYRKELRVNIAQADIERGHVVVKLDPARIEQVYRGMSGMRFTILKKVLRCGTGGKTYIEDLRDIISAAQREIELLKEDGEA